MADDQRPASQSDVKAVAGDVEKLERKVDAYIEERRVEEAKRLRTALTIATGMVIGMLTFVWWEIVWPAIKSSGGGS